jgi:homoserine dehydrogenase
LGAPKEIYVEGIRAITRADIEFAGETGLHHQAAGRGQRGFPAARAQKVQVSVYPALVPNATSWPASIMFLTPSSVRGDVVGDTLFYGRGAGKDATASAVLSDIADAALDLKHGTCGAACRRLSRTTQGAVLPIAEVVSRYYLRLNVVDKPGTLAKITAILAASKIGISSVIQPEGHEGRKRAADLDEPRSAQCRHAKGAGQNRPLCRWSKAPPVMLRVESSPDD